jgi:hypothetical protein
MPPGRVKGPRFIWKVHVADGSISFKRARTRNASGAHMTVSAAARWCSVGSTLKAARRRWSSIMNGSSHWYIISNLEMHGNGPVFRSAPRQFEPISDRRQERIFRCTDRGPPSICRTILASRSIAVKAKLSVLPMSYLWLTAVAREV